MDVNGEEAKLQQYMNRISHESHTQLYTCVTSEEELCLIAQKLTDWESKYYLFNLDYSDISDIKSQYVSPSLQRREVIQKWKNKAGVDGTYYNLLKICAKGEWHDSAMVIVNLLKKSRDATLDESCDTIAKELVSPTAASCLEKEPSSAVLDSISVDPLLQCITDLEFKFADLASGLLSHLKNVGVSVEKLTSYINLLPRSINIYVFPMWQKLCKKISHDDETLDSLFAILNMEVWNILDFNLLEYFIKRLGSKQLKKEMSNYVSELNQFKKSTLVSEFIECWEGHNRDIPDYVEVTFKFDKQNLKLAELDEFRKKLIRKCFPSLLDFAGWVYYKDFQNGCFLVSWMLPEQLALLLKEHAHSMFMLLEEYGVNTIMLNGNVVYTSEKAIKGGRDRLSSLPSVSLKQLLCQTPKKVLSSSKYYADSSHQKSIQNEKSDCTSDKSSSLPEYSSCILQLDPQHIVCLKSVVDFDQDKEDPDLYKIARGVPQWMWEVFVFHLGVMSQDCEGYVYFNQFFKALKLWKKSAKFFATYDALLWVACDQNLADTVDVIMDLVTRKCTIWKCTKVDFQAGALYSEILKQHDVPFLKTALDYYSIFTYNLMHDWSCEHAVKSMITSLQLPDASMTRCNPLQIWLEATAQHGTYDNLLWGLCKQSKYSAWRTSFLIKDYKEHNVATQSAYRDYVKKLEPQHICFLKMAVDFDGEMGKEDLQRIASRFILKKFFFHLGIVELKKSHYFVNANDALKQWKKEAELHATYDVLLWIACEANLTDMADTIIDIVKRCAIPGAEADDCTAGETYLKFLRYFENDQNTMNCLKSSIKYNWKFLWKWRKTSIHLNSMEDFYLSLGLSDANMEKVIENHNQTALQKFVELLKLWIVAAKLYATYDNLLWKLCMKREFDAASDIIEHVQEQTLTVPTYRPILPPVISYEPTYARKWEVMKEKHPSEESERKGSLSSYQPSVKRKYGALHKRIETLTSMSEQAHAEWIRRIEERLAYEWLYSKGYRRYRQVKLSDIKRDEIVVPLTRHTLSSRYGTKVVHGGICSGCHLSSHIFHSRRQRRASVEQKLPEPESFLLRKLI